MKRIFLFTALFVAAMPITVLAGSVFLNGVDIGSIRNQTFKNATVTIDKDGNVLIKAPGYKVEVLNAQAKGGSVTAASSAKEKGGPNPNLSKQYYLVTQPSVSGRAQFDFVVSVNGVEHKRIKAGSPQIIMEISAWLKKGDNEIEIRAVKNLSKGRISVAKSDEAKLIIGIGHVENKTVKIDSVKSIVKVNASQTTGVVKHLVLTAN